MHCVIDSNVLISHLLLPGSVPSRAVSELFRHHTVFTAEAQLLELKRVLAHKKFDRYVAPKDRQVFVYKFYKIARTVEIVRQINVCRDADDNVILGIAAAAEAELILSGDRDLLVLHPFGRAAIVSPGEYLKQF